MNFSNRSPEIGDLVSITTTASPDSVVLLSVMDRSLTLLADECKSLEKANVMTLLIFININRGLNSSEKGKLLHGG